MFSLLDCGLEKRAAAPLPVRREHSLGFAPAQTRAKGQRPLDSLRWRKHTGTVSESVSESIERAVKNSGELKQVILDFTGDFAIFLTLNRAFQVAERRRKLASYEVAGAMKKNKCPERTMESSDFQRPFRTQFLCAFYQPQCGWLISEVPAGQKRDATMANVPPLARAILVLIGFNSGKNLGFTQSLASLPNNPSDDTHSKPDNNF